MCNFFHNLGLSASKLWDKKYPIVISTPARQGNDAKEVVLFARTCRDKEYWFRLLKRSAEQSSANTTVTQTSGPDKDKPVTSDDEVSFYLYENYLRQEKSTLRRFRDVHR